MTKRVLFALLAAAIPCISNAGASVLETPKHIVVMVSRCHEGDVVCGKVTYTGVDMISGASISVEGSDWFAMCADGVTPCHQLGWRFKKGDTEYQISNEGELVVTVKGKTVLVENGKWIVD